MRQATIEQQLLARVRAMSSTVRGLDSTEAQRIRLEWWNRFLPYRDMNLDPDRILETAWYPKDVGRKYGVKAHAAYACQAAGKLYWVSDLQWPVFEMIGELLPSPDDLRSLISPQHRPQFAKWVAVCDPDFEWSLVVGCHDDYFLRQDNSLPPE